MNHLLKILKILEDATPEQLVELEAMQEELDALYNAIQDNLNAFQNPLYFPRDAVVGQDAVTGDMTVIEVSDNE